MASMVFKKLVAYFGNQNYQCSDLTFDFYMYRCTILNFKYKILHTEPCESIVFFNSTTKFVSFKIQIYLWLLDKASVYNNSEILLKLDWFPNVKGFLKMISNKRKNITAQLSLCFFVLMLRVYLVNTYCSKYLFNLALKIFKYRHCIPFFIYLPIIVYFLHSNHDTKKIKGKCEFVLK